MSLQKKTRTKFRPEYPKDYAFDYKDPVSLFRFVMEGGKITPSRIGKLSNGQQRRMTEAVKRARSLGLLPLGTDAYDSFGRPEQVSAKPFEF